MGFARQHSPSSFQRSSLRSHSEPHPHVVPRWSGDQNFMPIIGHTKTLPQLLTETRALVAGAWAAG